MSIGKFVISLDFELMWGVIDIKNVDQYKENIKGVHKVIPRLLETFNTHGINATFSTVGFLFFETKQELLNNLPSQLPGYLNKSLSPYSSHIEKIGENCHRDLYHFAPDLIKLILQYPKQEIGTHTFSHYYCLEEGQTIEDFRADLIQAKKVADKFGINLSSLVFPRNQFNDDYLLICKELGIMCIRGNESSWLYEPRSGRKESLVRRALRLADTYINISGQNCYGVEQLKNKLPVNIPASRFLRPFSSRLQVLDGLRLKRIKSGMTHAAKEGLIYHLWWHPHNFGTNQDENFAFLEKILTHYDELHLKYNFESHTLTSLANKIINY